MSTDELQAIEDRIARMVEAAQESDAAFAIALDTFRQHSLRDIRMLTAGVRASRAEIERLRAIVFAIIAALESNDGRDHSWGSCHICQVDDRVPHEDDCGYKLGLEYCKRTWPEIWKEDE